MSFREAILQMGKRNTQFRGQRKAETALQDLISRSIAGNMSFAWLMIGIVGGGKILSLFA